MGLFRESTQPCYGDHISWQQVTIPILIAGLSHNVHDCILETIQSQFVDNFRADKSEDYTRTQILVVLLKKWYYMKITILWIMTPQTTFKVTCWLELHSPNTEYRNSRFLQNIGK
jgi:hypothetical protein